MAKYTLITNELKDKLDRETGEITQVNTRKVIEVKLGSEEKFYMAFIEHMAPMYQLTHANDIKVLLKFCEMAEYETGVVQLSPKRRATMVEEINMQTTNVSKSIKRLKEKSLITGDNGEYTLNPVIFWKGKRAKRLELLKSKSLEVVFNFRIEGWEDEL